MADRRGNVRAGITVLLRGDEASDLRRFADQDCQSLSGWCRRAIRRELENYRQGHAADRWPRDTLERMGVRGDG